MTRLGEMRVKWRSAGDKKNRGEVQNAKENRGGVRFHTKNIYKKIKKKLKLNRQLHFIPEAKHPHFCSHKLKAIKIPHSLLEISTPQRNQSMQFNIIYRKNTLNHISHNQ